MSFSTPFTVNLFHFYKMPRIEGSLVEVNHYHPDGVLFVNDYWSYHQLVYNVCYTMGMDQMEVCGLTLVWSDDNGVRRYTGIDNDSNVTVLYAYGFYYPELYV